MGLYNGDRSSISEFLSNRESRTVYDFMTSRIILFFLFVAALNLNSCNNSTEPIEVTDSVYGIPVVPGLIITNREGPETIGIWRNPHLPNGEYHYWVNWYDNIEVEIPGPLKIRLETPYPNPTDSIITIHFTLALDTKVSLWLIRARLPEDNFENIRNSTGGVFASANNKIVLLNDLPMEIGEHSVQFQWEDEEGKNLPGGFYRVYFNADGHTLWCDVLFAEVESDIPIELRK